MESDLAAWVCRNLSPLGIGIHAETENGKFSQLSFRACKVSINSRIFTTGNPGADKVQKPFGKEPTLRLNSAKGENLGPKVVKAIQDPLTCY